MTVVVLLSGGLDSAACVAHAIERGLTVHCLSVAYGQRHWVEISRAAKIANAFKAQIHYETVGAQGIGPAALRDEKAPPPTSVAAIVPCRNIAFVAAAGMLASRVGASEVVCGFSADDVPTFADCSAGFRRAAADVLSISLGRRVLVTAPFGRVRKSSVIEWCRSRPAAWKAVALSWSCYAPVQLGLRGHVRPCGECGACVLRSSAFDESGYADPARDEIRA